MRRRRAFGVTLALICAAFVACTLNPQPLPPLDEDNNAGGGAWDAGSRAPDATAAGEGEHRGPPQDSDAAADPGTDSGDAATDDGGADAATDAGGDADATADEE